MKTGEDLVFNYGIFNFNKPHFVARFVFGLTDYELGIVPTQPFLDYYRKWGSSVTEQVLNLTDEDKVMVTNALVTNALPQNKVYRYNYFYDNCSTRPRDIVECNIAGNVVYDRQDGPALSWREAVRKLTSHHPWATFGNDMLLGVKADMTMTQREQEFLPFNLMVDFDNASIERDGQNIPLVMEKRTLVEPGVQVIEKGFPLRPIQCAIILAIVSIALFTLEWRRRRTFKYWDALLMLLTGLSGCIILTMFFSQHPTTSTNLLIFLLNPLPLFFIPAVLKRKRLTRYWKLSLLLICLFLVGGIWQSYAEGMYVVALCLLLRACSHFKNDQ